MSLHKGQCLCGSVQFELEDEFTGFFVCHCSRCRKDTGSAFATNLFASGANFCWLAGEDKVKHFQVPDTRFEKSFCRECGSPLATLQDGRLLIPAGTLDTPLETKPTANIFMDSRAPWEDKLSGAKRYSEFPS